MKLSESFTKLVPSILHVRPVWVEPGAVDPGTKGIPVGVAYAVWAGLGTALIAVIAPIAFGESLTPAKIVCLALIIPGVIGLNMSGGGH